MIAIATLACCAIMHSTPGHDGHPKKFSTINGKEYRGCKVLKVDPDGVTFRHDKGMAKIGFKDMPFHLRDRYFYNPVIAKEFITLHTLPSKEAMVRHFYLKKYGKVRYNKTPYGVYRDPYTGAIGAYRDPATRFYDQPYSNLSISDQLYQNHFSKHAQRTYGGARIGSQIMGPRYMGYIRNAYPRQIGTFGAGPSGGSLVPPVRSGYSTAGPVAPSLAPAARR